jgi:hypothetical protein
MLDNWGTLQKAFFVLINSGVLRGLLSDPRGNIGLG